jgi:transglutaminase-like putative cysteine protease
MQIRLGYELIYECEQPTPMVLMLNIHFSRVTDLVIPDHILTSPTVPIRRYRDGFGNLCSRMVAPKGKMRISTDAVIKDSGKPDLVAPDAKQHAIEDLPTDTLIFLLGSRYCETDRLLRKAWKLFGKTAPGWPRVQAICNYVHHRLRFGYKYARATRTALEAYKERRGVCRDYTHLAITFCRCMNIPARYCTGYLGDIGVPPAPEPMDFSTWFEAYLGGRWYVFDPRHQIPRIGRVLIAQGRDAADVPISNTFGPNELKSFKVWTDEV